MASSSQVTIDNQPMPHVIVHGLERSVYTRIVRLALEEKGVDYTLREVEIFGPNGVPSDHLTRHPFGRIPVLEHQGFQLYETFAITRYIDEHFPGSPLQPTAARDRARLNQIVGVLDAYAYRPMVWGVFVERVLALPSGADEATVATSLVESRRCLEALCTIADCSPWLVGEQITLADLHAFPILRYLALASEGREILQGFPELRRWLERMSLRASVQRTMSEYERVDEK